MRKGSLPPISLLLFSNTVTVVNTDDMKPLSSVEINKVLENNNVTKRFFIGTYPSCITPKTSKRTYAFITNVDEHDMPGLHWNAWFVEGRKISFFDSFGRDWEDETLPKHYRDTVKLFEKIHYTTDRVQGWDSVACGFFCVHFLYIKSLGLDYDDFLADYTMDFEKNDRIVHEFYNSIH